MISQHDNEVEFKHELDCLILNIQTFVLYMYGIAMKLMCPVTAVIYTDSLCIIFPYWIIFGRHASQCNLWGDSLILVMLLQFTKHLSN